MPRPYTHSRHGTFNLFVRLAPLRFSSTHGDIPTDVSLSLMAREDGCLSTHEMLHDCLLEHKKSHETQCETPNAKTCSVDQNDPGVLPQT